MNKSLWKKTDAKLFHNTLWKSEKLSTLGCGLQTLGITGFARVFHISFYYYCYYYKIPFSLLER